LRTLSTINSIPIRIKNIGMDNMMGLIFIDVFIQS
jgi:hypothetical protein